MWRCVHKLDEREDGFLLRRMDSGTKNCAEKTWYKYDWWGEEQEQGYSTSGKRRQFVKITLKVGHGLENNYTQ
ncbi:hypothetical protein J6590_008448 [Homalodisca vitripennis]|nr:hypothetical protein J6590_008448 [Homalodisca vitripennis]